MCNKLHLYPKSEYSLCILFKKGTGETIDRIVVKSGSTINVIPVADVIYLEAQDDYVMVEQVILSPHQ
jgi:DNA-binding LytR/AlgR family response regulator